MSNLMKYKVVPVDTFPPIINWLFPFSLLRHMTLKKLVNIHEALDYLENLDVSSEDELSDDKDLMSRVRLVILPPKDDNDRDNDEDSGDENEILRNNLNRSQLLAGATVDFSTSSGNISLGAGDEEEVAGHSVDVPSKRNKGSKVNVFL